MAKKRRPFKMKQFEVIDAASANKIGVDGVMIGSWTPIPSPCRRILDVGCGCGLIALMMAQRVADATVTGIDIEPNAVEEARDNSRASVFSDRINIRRQAYDSIVAEIADGSIPRFDIIVSNPPFFESGVSHDTSERTLARHAGTLSPETLLRHAATCLTAEGILAFIAPYEYFERYLQQAGEYGLRPIRACIVRGNPEATPKRVMIAMTPNLSDRLTTLDGESDFPIETLTIETTRGCYTPEYIALGKPFYIKF